MYQVIARKYRPQSFDDVIGQDHVTIVMKNAIESGRIPHAFIFSGPRGVGKTSIARILAKAISCEKGPAVKPCNECPICIDITASRAVDVFEIDAASHTGVENIRDLIENSRYAPSTARYKTFIIDEAHMLSKSAFNALLKTLEEPPPHVVFILATTELNKIPATVLSRCQSYDFRRIPVVDIVNRLKDIASKEELKISEDALTLIAIQADGGMRDAQGILERVTAIGSETEIGINNIEKMLGLLSMSTMHDVLESLLTRDSIKLLGLIDDIYKYGHDLIQLYKDIIEQFRNMMVIKTGYEDIPLPKDEMFFLKDLIKDVSFEEIHRAISVLIRSETDMKFSSLPKITFETIMLRIISAPRLFDLRQLLNISHTGNVTSERPFNGRESPKKQETTASSADQSWEGFKAYLKENEQSLYRILSTTALIAKDDNTITINASSEFSLEQIKRQRNEIEKHAALFFQGPISLKIETTELNSIRENQPKSTELRSNALNTPVVKEIMSEFNGTIKDVR